MESPRDLYKYYRNVNNIEDIAFYTLFEKYLIEDLKGDEKLLELESTDQESIVTGLNGGVPLPGFFYTFMYQGKTVKKGKNEFLDYVPIVFCMSIKNTKTFSGINLNMLPNKAKLDFLQTYYNAFSSFYEEKVDDLAQNAELALNKKFIDIIKDGKGQKTLKMFSASINQNFNFAYRKYLFKNIRKFRMVEYREVFTYIPFYEPKDAFRKMTYNDIHNLYRQSK